MEAILFAFHKGWSFVELAVQERFGAVFQDDSALVWVGLWIGYLENNVNYIYNGKLQVGTTSKQVISMQEKTLPTRVGI